LGYDAPWIVASGEEAIKKVGEVRPDLVLMDIKLDGELDGIEAACEIKRRYRVAIVFLTAYSDPILLERAKQCEPSGYLLKPFRGPDLRTTVEVALHKFRLEEESRLKELNNILERALILSGTNRSEALLPHASKTSAESKDIIITDIRGRTLHEVTTEITRAMCLNALDKCSGNKKEAAKLLGIARESLYRYLKEFGILS